VLVSSSGSAQAFRRGSVVRRWPGSPAL